MITECLSGQVGAMYGNAAVNNTDKVSVLTLQRKQMLHNLGAGGGAESRVCMLQDLRPQALELNHLV